MLAMNTFTLPLHQDEVEPIKSYLYVPPPKPEKVDEISPEPVAVEQEEPSKEHLSPNKTEQDVVQQVPVEVVKPKEITESQPIQKLPKLRRPTSVRSQLFDLKQQLEQQVTQDVQSSEFERFERYRQGDVMAGKHIPVPHSVVPLSPEEKRKQATSDLGGFQIIKGDDGNCTLVEDLSYLGLDIKARSGFSCGESKFDRNFRQHMEKTFEKMGRKKKNN